MNWDAVSAISEAIGVVVVIISLIYLATQIKHAKLAAADLSRHLRSNGVREIGFAMATNSDLRKNWIAAGDLERGYAELAEKLAIDLDGAAQLDWLVTSWIWLHWGQFSSTTTQTDIEELEKLVGTFYASRPISTIWYNSPYPKGMTDPDFVNFVETAVAKYGAREGEEIIAPSSIS